MRKGITSLLSKVMVWMSRGFRSHCGGEEVGGDRVGVGRQIRPGAGRAGGRDFLIDWPET